MSLPGGIRMDGELRRDFRFRPITGELELMLSESMQYADNHALRVTIVLCRALETLGGAPASAEAVRALSVGDRQFLMARLAAHIHDLPVWVTAHCGHCQELFDTSYRYADLPVKTAGADYPRTQVDTPSLTSSPIAAYPFELLHRQRSLRPICQVSNPSRGRWTIGVRCKTINHGYRLSPKRLPRTCRRYRPQHGPRQSPARPRLPLLAKQ